MKEIKIRSRLLLVRQEKTNEEQKIGNIIIPDIVKKKLRTTWGVVVAIGKGTNEKPMEVSVGDRVCFEPDSSRVTIGDNMLIKHEDVLYYLPCETN